MMASHFGSQIVWVFGLGSEATHSWSKWVSPVLVVLALCPWFMDFLARALASPYLGAYPPCAGPPVG